MLLDANSLQAQRKELLEVAGTSDSTPAVPANAKKSGVRRALPVGSAVRANNKAMELDSSKCFSDLSRCFREERKKNSSRSVPSFASLPFFLDR